MTALFGLGLAGMAVRRFRLYSSRQPGPESTTKFISTVSFDIFDAVGCFLVLAIGFVLARIVISGSIAFFGLIAAAISFAPWLKVQFCRRHFILSCLLLQAAAASALFFSKPITDPMRLPLAAWALWTVAAVTLLRDVFTRTADSAALASMSSQAKVDLEKVRSRAEQR
jgi:uncharacterized BrkB/YihY/UPF0761 family membrane protein